MRKPRVCLATDSPEPSGVGEHMLALAAELRDALDIVLACPDNPGGRTLLTRAARLGLGVLRLDGNVAALLRRDRYDLVHVHAGIGWEGHGLAAAARQAGVPALVRTEHLPDVITDPGQREDHRRGLALVDRVVCVSEASASSHRDAGAPAGKLVTIRNGIAPAAPRRARQEVRAALGLDPAGPVLITVARFTPQKDHATLLAALPDLRARHPGAVLLLVGTGPLEAEVRARAGGLGIGHAVRFLGSRDDVPDLLGAADLFVLPSRFEGLPLAPLEAMAAGLPVVPPRSGGTAEVVVDGETGALVPPGDAESLAAAMTRLLDDPGRAAAFGRAGRDRMRSSFSARRMAEETLGLYRALDIAAGEQDRMTGAAPARTRIGFVGAGGIAQRHLGVLETFEDVELAAFADEAEERARACAERFGARAYPGAEAMLVAEKLDALYICVPPFAHGPMERLAVERRLPFFVEKPLSLDLATAEGIARAVAETGLVTGVGYHWRYLDTVEEARRLLADNPAQLLSGYWLDATPPPRWWWRQDGSGGQMIEQTTHIVDLARYLAGEVVQVFGLAGHKPRPDFPGLDVATASTASLKFASGAVANLASTCLLGWNHRVGLHVFADGMAIELTDHDIMVDVGRGRPYRGAEGDPVWKEDRDFVDAVRGGPNRIRVPYAEALASHRVALAIGRSAVAGVPVDPRPPAPGPASAGATPAQEAAHV